MDSISHHIYIGLAGGIIAFGHCVGMCGGFVLHLSRDKGRHAMLSAQLLWHGGKLMSYLFLGALAGFAGGHFQLFFLRHGVWQELLGYLAGVAMFSAGLSLLGLLPVPGRGGGLPRGMLASLGALFSSPSPGAALLLGAATGFLPCPVILAFVAYSAATGSVPGGMACMAALSLGTSLPLALLGGTARLTRWHLRSWAPRAGGVVLILLAAGTALRGSTLYHELLGCPAKPVLHEGSPDANSQRR